MNMKYITGKLNVLRIWAVALVASVVFLTYLSCADEFEQTAEGHNYAMSFATRAGDGTSAADLVPNMRLFAFTQNTKMYHNEVLNIARSTNKLTAKVETGTWNMVMVSSPSGFALNAPQTNVSMDNMPMYVYQPVVNNGRSTSAAELFFQNKLTPVITTGVTKEMDVRLNRVVAKVELIVRRTTPNFKLAGNHKIELRHVPSTISYAGKLLPGAADPKLLSESLKAPVKLVQANNGFLKGSDTITFIIPAHQGSDFMASAPTDTIKKKMSITIDLERAGGGSRFTKTVEINKVAMCNRVLRVNIDVSDGVECATEVLPWERVDITANVGQKYQNWLYVKKDGVGSGLSWNDPLPDMTTAIAKAKALVAASRKVNGILVAGGEELVYNEGLTIPANIKIYGGWKGESGTELAPDDTTGPYTSAARNLKTGKARIATGAESIVLSAAGAIFEGFIVSGSGGDSHAGLVTVSNASAWINAVEIDNQTGIDSKHALSISAGVGTNVLVTRNNKGVSVTGNGKLVNATIADNTSASTFSGILRNSIYWGNSGTAVVTGKIDYCAFQGSVPAGKNYPVNATNDKWFTASNVVPGPHFDLGTTSGLARYEVGTAKPVRSPMLRRGDKSSFDENLPVKIADQYKKDIDGNIRFHKAIDGSTQVVDIGCYENGSYKGFQLRWATENVYVSAKKGYFSQLPLLLPANEDPDVDLEVSWTVTIKGGSLTDCTFDGSVVNGSATGSSTGAGKGVLVGVIQFTPSVEYTQKAERKLGTIAISTQLGSYLPDTELQIWQTSGVQYKWTQGYVGSFHRNKERGARFIHGYNQLGGDWNVRIFSGTDWIKIDDGEKNDGEDITDADEGKTPSGGYYKEVDEAWGGIIKGSGQDIKFRVGMKSKNTTGKPRYGLIIITRKDGISYFFVRQGEDPDYVYRLEDTRPTAGARTESYVQKFAVYNLIDPNKRSSSMGTDIGARGGGFTNYPTQVGYYFKFSSTTGFLYGVGKFLSYIKGTDKWDKTKEVCPPGYRHASQLEYINSLYYDVKDIKDDTVSPESTASRKNYEAGAYADGWYDQLLPERSKSYHNVGVGSTWEYAVKGVLIVSHYNYASLFFPASGGLWDGGHLHYTKYAMYNTNHYRNTHWGQEDEDGANWSRGHIGMNCTTLGRDYAAPVRCVYEGD
jgi:hypothetical protein